MWPYDYFNQYSNIEIDYNIGSKKKLFFAFSYDNEQKKSNNFKQAIVKLNSDFKDFLFEPVIANDIKKGDINTNILTEIIASTFVICDITPIIDNKENLVFNANVMTELGLALAWKMKEQVIVLWDKEKDKYFPKDFPFDLHDYYVDKIDLNYDGLTDIIKRRICDLKFTKDILFKNVISKLDALSLKFIGINHHNGLGSTPKHLNLLSLSTIRHLLNLGLLKAISFPSQDIPYIYSWTGMGRILLTNFNYKLYPPIIVDADSMCYCRGYPNMFEDKKIDFNIIYKIQWENVIKYFLDCLDKEVKNRIKEKFGGTLEDADLFHKYLRDDTFDNIYNNILPKFKKLIEA